MPTLQIVTTPDGRALEYDGEQVPLPALAVDATVHAYATPSGLWADTQAPGKPRPVYPGRGGQKLGTVALEADPEAVLEREKARAMRRINEAYQGELETILADYPEAETKTWDKQEQEARAWQSDSAATTPLIDAIAAARGMDKAELVSRIIAKADAWVDLSGAATGKRQALEDQVAQSATLEAVEAIVW